MLPIPARVALKGLQQKGAAERDQRGRESFLGNLSQQSVVGHRLCVTLEMYTKRTMVHAAKENVASHSSTAAVGRCVLLTGKARAESPLPSTALGRDS